MGKRVTPRFKERPRHFIKEWRKSKNLTQEALAAAIGMATSSISQIETGKTGYSQPLLEQLAEYFGCEPGELLMRNPLDKRAPWSLADSLKPENRAKVEEYIELLADSEKRDAA
jgi:transcriptional regulator with XRE-family HTH domain